MLRVIFVCGVYFAVFCGICQSAQQLLIHDYRIINCGDPHSNHYLFSHLYDGYDVHKPPKSKVNLLDCRFSHNSNRKRVLYLGHLLHLSNNFIRVRNYLRLLSKLRVKSNVLKSENRFRRPSICYFCDLQRFYDLILQSVQLSMN